MVDLIRLMFVDDAPGNLAAARQAAEDLSGKDIVSVRVEYRRETPIHWPLALGELLQADEMHVTHGLDSRTTEVVNELLQQGPITREADCGLNGVATISISPPQKITEATFYDNAGDALKAISGVHGVVTDFFFKGHDEHIHPTYSNYVQALEQMLGANISSSSPTLQQIYEMYRAKYRDWDTLVQGHQRTIEALKTGKISERRLRELLGEKADGMGDLSKYLSDIKPEFAYGGPIMLEAQ